MDDNDNDDKGLHEPSILSADPEERKLARRTRLQRRLSASRRDKAIAEGTYDEPEPPKPLLELTIENSDDTLIQLFLEGKELVTNVRVACDTREVQRRQEELEARNLRMKKLEDEANLAMEKLNHITSKWDSIQESNDPLNLYQDMKNQKDKCLELIQQKDELISDFQLELRLADEQFMRDRRRMFEDIRMMAKRIDEQIQVMKNGYRKELQIIEDAVDETRRRILLENSETWQELYDTRENDETANIEHKFDMVEAHEEEVKRIHREHEEVYRESKIRLETDIQTLEQELEHVKALCLLNTEKLDYNYQVLKKREEENVYIKNHQKRKLNNLQDTVNTLKRKIAEKQVATDQELKRLMSEVQRYHANVLDVEEKADHFANINESKYQEIWDMKQEEAIDLLDKIMSIDKIIHEQILGEDWRPPDKKIMNKKDLPSFRSAMDAVVEVFKDDATPTRDAPSDAEPPEIQRGYKKLLRHILEMLADQSGFLIEERLDELLKPYTEQEATLVRLDNVFTAIGISTAQDIDFMKDFFLPYARCGVCEAWRQPSLSVGDSAADATPDQSETSLPPDHPASVQRLSQDTTTESKQDDGTFIATVDPLELMKGKARSVERAKCNYSHPLHIEKIMVLRALKDCVSKMHADKAVVPTGMNVRLAKQRCTVSRMLTKEDVNGFWQSFKGVFPPEEEKVWEALFEGLTKYHKLLQERHKLNVSAQKLRAQNQDLRKLLAKYLSQVHGREIRKLCLPEIVAAGLDGSMRGEDLIELIKKVSL